jgi:glycosyltransferase involved in cell wall biosynthesis
MVVIEAMAQGVPSIAGDIGGPRDTIEDGEDGLLVPPGDPLALADAIEKLILAPDYLAQLRQNAFDAVHRKYRHADMIDTYLVYINSILAS